MRHERNGLRERPVASRVSRCGAASAVLVGLGGAGAFVRQERTGGVSRPPSGASSEDDLLARASAEVQACLYSIVQPLALTAAFFHAGHACAFVQTRFCDFCMKCVE